MKQLITSLILYAIASNVFAQSSLVLYDGDDERIGQFLYEYESATGDIVVVAPDGYLLRLEALTGRLVQAGVSGFRFESDDCTGQAYVDTGGTGVEWLTWKGGHVVRVFQGAPEPRFGRVEWFPVEVQITARSSGITGGTCNPLSDALISVIPATIIDPASYKIKDLGGGEWGIKPPLKMQLEATTANGIFCDGFENCPQQ